MDFHTPVPGKRKVTLVFLGLLVAFTSRGSTQTTNCRTKLCSSCSELACNGFACYNYGTCKYTYVDGEVSGCLCDCSIGFTGAQCTANAMLLEVHAVAKEYLMEASVAWTHINRTIAMLQDHQVKQPSFLVDSLYYMANISEEITTKLEHTLTERHGVLNLANVTTEMAAMTSYFLRGIEEIGCTVIETPCQINRTDVNDLISRSEAVMIKMVYLLFHTKDYNNTDTKQYIKGLDDISMTAIRSEGSDLPFTYTAEYGSLTLPYWETFQSYIGQRRIVLNVMTYKSSPYIHLDNLNDSLTGSKINTSTMTYSYDNTAPVVRLSNHNDNERFVQLDDGDDPIEVGIDMSKMYGGDEYFSFLDMLNDDEGKSILSISFNNTDLDAYVVEFKIATLKNCEVWGKYGVNGVPSDENHDVYIKTRGSGRMSKVTPKDLIVNFQSSLLKITVKNVNYPQNTTTDPLTFILRCEDDFFKRKKRKKRHATQSRHRYRVSSIGGRCLNSEQTAWITNINGKCIQVLKAKGNELVFKSTFFGSFSAQAFFIGPTPIQFDEIFLNFDDRLAESPHVLATFVSVIVLSVLAVIPLRRADKRDKIYWTYLPLIDNPDEGHSIFLSVQTSTSSPRTMSANVYIELVGTTGRTGPRILSDGVRQNFCRGTSSHFVLVTSASIGKLKKLIIWHDNGGKNPRWCLSKVVVLEEETKEKYMFLCQEWLCLDCDDGQTWRRLHPTTTEIMDDNIVFRESSRKRFYDDFLWISLIHRPNYSVFTRVQRLWTLIGMLFLAMLTSAMWYDTSQNESSTAFGNLKIGPFTFSYRQIYVGIVSSFISLLPSLIVISIFKYRRLRGDENNIGLQHRYKSVTKTGPNKNQTAEDVKEKKRTFCDVLELAKEPQGKVNPKRINYLESEYCKRFRKSASKQKVGILPWWTIILAYVLLFSCITVGGTLTFFYSLQFGNEKTNNWFLSFIFGVTGSICVIEPLKAIVMTILITCFLRRLALNDIKDCPSPTINENIEIKEKSSYTICPCPSRRSEDLDVKIMRHRAQLDRKLSGIFRTTTLRFLYVLIVLLLGSHNFITKSFRQNAQLIQSINQTFKANSTEDIWTWLKEYYIPAIWPKFNTANKPLSAYQQRFLSDQFSYRLGHTRMRQARVHGNCTVDPVMAEEVKICKHDYTLAQESNINYCPGWKPFNVSCFEYEDNNQANEEIDASFLYFNSTSTKSLYHFGKFAIYDGGGYTIYLGPKQSIVMDYVEQLRALGWIDLNTRVLFIDTNSFNPSTRLFSHTQTVFEMSAFGDVIRKSETYSMNLYPYVTISDFIILALQLIFCVILCIKIIRLFHEGYLYRFGCLRRFVFYCDVFDILLGLAALVSFILRILCSIEAIEDIRNDMNQYISFEFIQIYDNIYHKCLAGISYLAIISILEPLTFNYYLFLLHRTLSSARSTFLHYLILLIVCVFAFSSFVFFLVGGQVKEFRDIWTSCVTFFQVMLAIISFRGSVKMQTLEVQIIIAIFSIVMSLIVVNLFITTLTMTFEEIKKAQTNNMIDVDPNMVFNQDLNGHFWMRTKQLFTFVFRKCFPEQKQNDEDKLTEYISALESSIEHFDILRKRAYLSEEESSKMFYEYATILFQRQKESRILLECVLTRTTTGIKYSFIRPVDGRTKVTLFVPSKALSSQLEVSCYEIGRSYVHEHAIVNVNHLRSSLYRFDTTNDINFNREIFLQLHDVNKSKSGIKYTAVCCWSENSLQQTTYIENERGEYQLKRIPHSIHVIES